MQFTVSSQDKEIYTSPAGFQAESQGQLKITFYFHSNQPGNEPDPENNRGNMWHP